jgi:hypothetical protein
MRDGACQLADCGEFLATPQSILDLARLRNVAKGDDSAFDSVIGDDRLRGHLRIKEGAVLAEDVVCLVGDGHALQENVVDGTLFAWVVTAVRIVVVHHLVHVAAHEFVRLKAQHPQRRAIYKRTGPIEINAPDSFTGRIQ